MKNNTLKYAPCTKSITPLNGMSHDVYCDVFPRPRPLALVDALRYAYSSHIVASQ